MNVFQQHGYVDREEFLDSLALSYNMDHIDHEKIKQIASIYSDEECFTSLISIIKSMIDMKAWKEEIMRRKGYEDISN